MKDNPPIISIIVPVYNVEKYLNKCIDSIINQSFKNFEIILVDDGSTDSSPKMCDEYAVRDDRIKVIHKKNGGLSDARNFGIKIAQGNFLGFIDSDDYIAEDMYQVLYENLLKHDADVSVCGLYNCYGKRITPQCKSSEFLILDNKQALETVLIGEKFSVNAVNKLYKKSLFKVMEFPIGRLSEDAFTIPKLLASAKRVVATTEPKYYYIHRKDSITTSEFKIKDLDVIKAYEMNLNFIKEKFPELKKMAEFRYLWSYTCVLDKMIMSTELKYLDEYEKIISKIRRNTLKIICNNIFSYKRKIATLALLISKSLYKKITVKNNERIMELFD